MNGTTRSAVLAGIAFAVGVGLVALSRVDPGPGFLLGGIQVNEPDHSVWFDAVRSEGLNTISATVYAKQGDWNSSHLWWSDEEPHVVAEIRGAKRDRLRVVLIPRVALDHAFDRNLFLWHGMILPEGEDALREWFARYREFVVRWARIAQSERVDLFAVGSELSALTSTRPLEQIPALETWLLDDAAQARRRDAMLEVRHELEDRHLWIRGKDDFESLESYLDAEIEAKRDWADRVTFGAGQDALDRINRRSRLLDRLWRELIAEVRGVYTGPLTYAANFDQYDRVGFWDALDRIGINAYWSLRPGGSDPSARELGSSLEDGWRGILDEVDAFRRSEGIPQHRVVFTEIGYTSRRNGTVQPWAGTGFWLADEDDGTELFVWGDEPILADERAEALRALGRALRARRGPRLLDGILWWKLSSIPEHRAIEPFVAVLQDPADAELFDALRSIARVPAGRPDWRSRRDRCIDP